MAVEVGRVAIEQGLDIAGRRQRRRLGVVRTAQAGQQPACVCGVIRVIAQRLRLLERVSSGLEAPQVLAQRSGQQPGLAPIGMALHQRVGRDGGLFEPAQAGQALGLAQGRARLRGGAGRRQGEQPGVGLQSLRRLRVGQPRLAEVGPGLGVRGSGLGRLLQQRQGLVGAPLRQQRSAQVRERRRPPGQGRQRGAVLRGCLVQPAGLLGGEAGLEGQAGGVEGAGLHGRGL